MTGSVIDKTVICREAEHIKELFRGEINEAENELIAYVEEEKTDRWKHRREEERRMTPWNALCQGEDIVIIYAKVTIHSSFLWALAAVNSNTQRRRVQHPGKQVSVWQR